MRRGESTGKSSSLLLPPDGDKATARGEGSSVGQHGSERSCYIGKVLLDVLHHLGIDDEVVHLMHTAALLLVLMVLSMLIVQVAVLDTLLKDHTYPLVMMMVHHYGREEHGEGRQPKMQYVQSLLHEYRMQN